MKKLIFIGCDEAQKKWGNHNGDTSILEIGKSYDVERIEVHSWHIKIYLGGIDGSYNSVCFEEPKNASR